MDSQAIWPSGHNEARGVAGLRFAVCRCGEHGLSVGHTDVQALCPLRLESVLFLPSLSLLSLQAQVSQPWVVSIAILFGLCLNLGSLLELDWLAREPPAPVSPHLAFPWVLRV